MPTVWLPGPVVHLQKVPSTPFRTLLNPREESHDSVNWESRTGIPRGRNPSGQLVADSLHVYMAGGLVHVRDLWARGAPGY